MRYYRWNLRNKLKKSSAVWHYADGTTDNVSGYFDGRGNHPKVNDIVAKKNVASSMQGHKMGACNMYDELFEACGLKTWPGQTVPVPYLDASPVCLECRVTEVKHLGSHDMFLAEVTAVLVDERYMNEKGRFCLEDSNLLSFIHGEYFATGEKCERFGGSVRKKK